MMFLKRTETMFLMVGLMIVIFAGYSYIKQADFLERAISAEAHVIDIEKRRRHSDKGVRYKYYPVLRFTDINGDIQTFRSNTGTNEVIRSPHGTGQTAYSIDEKFNILYLKEDPKNAIIDDFWSRWMWIFIASVLGIIFCFIGIGGMLFKAAQK